MLLRSSRDRLHRIHNTDDVLGVFDGGGWMKKWSRCDSEGISESVSVYQRKCVRESVSERVYHKGMVVQCAAPEVGVSSNADTLIASLCLFASSCRCIFSNSAVRNASFSINIATTDSRRCNSRSISSN